VPWPDTQYQVDGLTYGTTYWFVVTAINSDGLESAYSNEVAYTPMPPPDPTPTPAPTPSHGHGWWHNH
jgi:chitodextrinase